MDATKRYGPVSAPFFTLEGKGNKEHGKEKIERSRFNMTLAKNDLAVVEHPVVTVEAEQIIKEWKNNAMAAKTHVIIGEHSGPVVDKSNSGGLVDSLARQVGVSWLAEYIFETSALANELASNEPSSNKSHAPKSRWRQIQ